MADQRESGKRFSASRSLFYGRKKDDEEKSDISVNSDDSVDDPSFVVMSSDDDDENTTAVSSAVDASVLSDLGQDSVVVGESSGNAGEAVGGGARAVGGDARVVGAGRRGRPRERERGIMREKRGRVATRGLSKKQMAKKKKDAGEEYTSRAGKKVEKRKVGPPCKDGCYERVKADARLAINRNFWRLGSYDLQNNYISQHVRECKIKRRYGRGVKAERTQFEYTVKYLDEKYKVCAVAFRHIHDIGEKRIQLQMKRMRQSATGTPPGDLRGKKQPPNKVTGVRLEHVHEHIRSLPTTASHYTRAKSPHRVYLEAGGTITGEQGLYKKYLFWLEQKGFQEQPVTETFYKKIFCNQYNIAFKPPKKDTCATCDEMKAEMQAKKEKQEDTTAIEEKMERHQAIAKNAVDLLRAQAALVQDENLVVRSVAMDLQQTLPCPRISTGMAYYMRKMWVYNFCIYDLQKSKGTMFVWDETTGGRGSDEVSSCILKWVNLRLAEEEEFDVLRIFCDNCAGQNKNLFVILGALRLIHARKLFRIEIIYMISGHSFLPCDAKFGVIEKKIRRQESIHTTDHYVKVIKESANPPFEVIVMQREEFFDFKSLAKYITKRPTPVPFSQARQFIVDSGFKEGYLMRTDYTLFESKASCHQSRLMKGHNRKYSDKLFNLSSHPLQPKYHHEILLDPQKIKDLETLSQFMGPHTSRDWMLDLITRQRELQNFVAVGAPDEEEVGSDSENDLDDYSRPGRPAL